MKVVLIITDDREGSSDLVINWLNYYGQPFIRINYESVININQLYIEDGKFGFQFSFTNFLNEKILLSSKDLKSIWYRRSNLNIESPCHTLKKDKNLAIKRELIASNKNEKETITQFIHYLLKNNFLSINNYLDNHQNKLLNLDIAQKVGFKIPETFITSSKMELSRFSKKNNGQIITKPSAQGAPFGTNSNLDVYTTLIDKEKFENIPNIFPLSTFQTKIKKLFELRVFYIFGNCYSMAIFSQTDDKTKIDFRNYNLENPNRTIPYNLPKEIMSKIHSFMRRINLNCGSIDLIVDESLNYIFLEVNPVGQFYQLTSPCNYYLEKIIAKNLTNEAQS